ncbi:MAG TPA: hypothetical protein VE666_02075 [Mycobacterium sp.]|nr:hypothetical protein [Mycobacterium sp.]
MCVVGLALLGCERVLGGRATLGFGGGGGGGGGCALGGTVVGAIAGGAAEGALVTGGGIGAALGGGGGAVVVVTVRVGRTTPVVSNGCRDTTVIAETTTPTATTASTHTVTGPKQFVQDRRSRGHSTTSPDVSCAISGESAV